MVVAFLHRNAGPMRQVAVARAVNEHPAANRIATRFRFDDERIDASRLIPDHGCGQRMEEQLDAVGEQQRIGSELERRHVIRLRANAAEHVVGLVQAIERAHPVEQIGGDPVDDLVDLAAHVRVQAAEVGHAGRRPHPSEESVALDQQASRSVARRRRRSDDSGRTATQHDDVVFAEQRRRARGFEDVLAGRGRCAHRVSGC